MTDILTGVYFICDSGGVKIGFSHDIQKRMTDLQTGNSDKLYLLGYIPCESDSEMNLKEKLAHGEFDKHRKINEWFHKRIKPEARKYIIENKGKLLKGFYANTTGNVAYVQTLDGEFIPRTMLRPSCYYYPHLKAMIVTKAGGVKQEKYRTAKDKDTGKRVYISNRKHHEIMASNRARIDRL